MASMASSYSAATKNTWARRNQNSGGSSRLCSSLIFSAATRLLCASIHSPAATASRGQQAAVHLNFRWQLYGQRGSGSEQERSQRPPDPLSPQSPSFGTALRHGSNCRSVPSQPSSGSSGTMPSVRSSISELPIHCCRPVTAAPAILSLRGSGQPTLSSRQEQHLEPNPPGLQDSLATLELPRCAASSRTIPAAGRPRSESLSLLSRSYCPNSDGKVSPKWRNHEMLDW